MDKIKKILIAIDEGPTSEKVASNGFKLGQQLNAEIALISVIDAITLMTHADVLSGELGSIIKDEYEKNQQMLIDKLFKGGKVLTFIERGKPFETILKVADGWKADLIVLGTHGRTGLSHLIMGSVAEKVMTHSEIPSFIIPTKQ